MYKRTAVARRDFLRILAVVGGGATLAACSSPAASTPTSAPAAPATQPAAPGGSPAVAASAGPASSPAAAASPLAAASPSPVAQTAPVVANVGSITAAWVAINGSMVPAWIASDNDIYSKYGLKVDLQYIAGSPAGTAALLSNGVQILQTAGTGITSAVKQGASVAMVAGFVNVAVLKMMVDPSITSIADLRGKAISLSTPGGVDDFLTRRLLHDNGVQDNEVQFINSGDVNGQIAALANHQVVAAMLTPPEDLRATQFGAVDLLDTATLNIPYQSVGVGTTRAYIQDHNDQLLAFLKGEIDAIHQFKTNRPLAEASLSKYLNNTDPAVIGDAYDAYVNVFQDIPFPTEAGVQELLDEAGSGGKTPADIIDNSPMQTLVDSGFFQTLGIA